MITYQVQLTNNRGRQNSKGFSVRLISDKIQPIHLAGPKENRIMANTIAYVVGWGRDGYSPTGTKRLKYALMPLISKRKCTMYWRVDYRNICTVPGLGKNACQVWRTRKFEIVVEIPRRRSLAWWRQNFNMYLVYWWIFEVNLYVVSR